MAVASLFEDLLDQYKVEQHIAEKRYTNRFEAYDVDDNRLVWLDVLRNGYVENNAFAGRFVSRAQVLAQVRNPNIAPVLHIGKGEGGAPYVAQEAIDGYSLSHRLEQLARRQMAVHPVYALSLVRQLAHALILAERLELFHYDLQPDNIFLKNFALPAEDSVLLTDLFVPPEKPPKAPANGQNGTNAYLSPEQRAGREVTAASHVYSLGVILFRLLAGRMPAAPYTVKNKVASRVFAQAGELETERGGLTPLTYQLVERCLQKDPRRRFRDSETFLASLESALAAEENRAPAAASQTGRRAAWLAPLLLVLFLLAGAAAYQAWGSRPAAPDGAANAEIPDSGRAGLPVSFSPTPSPTALGQAATAASASPVVATNPTAAGTAESDGPVSPTATRTAPTITPSPTATTGSTRTATSSPPSLVRVVHNLVNMRLGPGIEYAVFGNVTGGEMLEVLAWNGAEHNPWLLVITPDRRIGWIAAMVVQINGGLSLDEIEVAATIPPPPPPTGTVSLTPSVTPASGSVTPSTTPGGGPGGIISTLPPDDTPEAPEPTPTSSLPEPTRTPPP